MKQFLCLAFGIASLCGAYGQSPQNKEESKVASKEFSAPKELFIEVEKGVKLEVIDWGGSGDSLIFIPGGGRDAHEFDHFAPKFAMNHHVYVITRRGSGASSAPAPDGENYSSDRLGDDVVRVIDKLGVSRPVLVGHSLGGVELSSVGSRYPQKVAGLIYLDAAYSYAYYSPAVGDPVLDVLDLHRRLDEVMSKGLGDAKQLRKSVQSTEQLNKSLLALEKERYLMPPQPNRPANAPPPPAIGMAYALERTKYTELHVPILAIFADPHDYGSLYKDNPAARAAVIANDFSTTSAQADALQKGAPSARVVRIADASHLIFQSNEDQVIKEMNQFLVSLH